ncbi:MAG: recombinase family protein, partial [Planctomycetaceae bacterium]|nr:recombinase family protein [Planctomycetaceae bacterium]
MPQLKRPVAQPRPVACYIRVSSKDQKTDSQRDVIARWLEGNG